MEGSGSHSLTWDEFIKTEKKIARMTQVIEHLRELHH